MFLICIVDRYIIAYFVLSTASLLCRAYDVKKNGTSLLAPTRIYPINQTTKASEIVSAQNDTSASSGFSPPAYRVTEQIVENEFAPVSEDDSKLAESVGQSKIQVFPITEAGTKLKLNNSDYRANGTFSSHHYYNSNGNSSFKPSSIDNSQPFLPNHLIPEPATDSFRANLRPRFPHDYYFSQPVKYEQFHQPDYPPFGRSRFTNKSPVAANQQQQRAEEKYKNAATNDVKIVESKHPGAGNGNSDISGYATHQTSYYPPADWKDPFFFEEYNSFHQKDWLQPEDTKTKLYHGGKTSVKPKKKTAILHALSTLIPIVLLLAAIPPKIVVLNSTEPRREDDPVNFETEADRSPISYLVENLGAVPSNEEQCNKLYLCEEALKGSEESDASLPQYSIWLLLSRGMKMAQEKLNLLDVVQAVRNEDCRTFFSKCTKPIMKQSKNDEFEKLDQALMNTTMS